LYRGYLYKLLLVCIIFVVFFGAMNYIVDPYGYSSRDGKSIKNLSMLNKPHVTNARLNSSGYYLCSPFIRYSNTCTSYMDYSKEKRGN